MEHSGLTARSIRLSKSFSQKEIYTGIVSKSYAIAFEQGKAMLSYHDLIEVLERLSVTLQEFEFIRGGYRNPGTVSLWRSFSLAANSKNGQQLEELYYQHRNDKADYNKVIACLSRAIHHSFSSDNPQPSPPCTKSEKQFLINYVMSKESWMLEEINLFSSYYYLFDADTQRQLIQTCCSSLRRYEEYPHYEERMYNLLTNYVTYCYRQVRRVEGDQWLLALRKLPRNNKAYLHQLLNARLCEAFHFAAHRQAEAGRAIAVECAGIFRSLGFVAESDDAMKNYESLLASYTTSSSGSLIQRLNKLSWKALTRKQNASV